MVCGCMCVYTHTHTHNVCGLYESEPRGRDETPREPEEYIWTKFGHKRCIHVFIHVYKVYMCIYMLCGGMRSWTSFFFLLTYCFFQKRKAKDVDVLQRTRIHIDLSYIDPLLRVLNYLMK